MSITSRALLLSRRNNFRLDFALIFPVLVALSIPLISSSCATIMPALLRHVCWPAAEHQLSLSLWVLLLPLSRFLILFTVRNVLTPLSHLKALAHLSFFFSSPPYWRILSSTIFLACCLRVKCISAYFSFYLESVWGGTPEDADSVQEKT